MAPFVDLYHARQHRGELSAKRFASDEPGRQRWLDRSLNHLDQGKIESLVKFLRQLPSLPEELQNS